MSNKTKTFVLDLSYEPWGKIPMRTIIDVISKSKSKAQVYKRLRLREGGDIRKALSVLIHVYGISTSHFKRTIRYSDSEIFMKDSLVGQNTLKRRYMKKHAKKTCACGTIFSKTIKSELDHINGINNDNRLENLELRCPNCHRACATSCVGNKGAREAAILEQRMNKNIDKFFEITND